MKNFDKYELIIRASEAPEFGMRKVFDTRQEMELFYYNNFRNCRGRRFESRTREGFLVIEELLVCQEFHYHLTHIIREVED